jgi:hypothetical protein
MTLTRVVMIISEGNFRQLLLVFDLTSRGKATKYKDYTMEGKIRETENRKVEAMGI